MPTFAEHLSSASLYPGLSESPLSPSVTPPLTNFGSGTSMPSLRMHLAILRKLSLSAWDMPLPDPDASGPDESLILHSLLILAFSSAEMSPQLTPAAPPFLSSVT